MDYTSTFVVVIFMVLFLFVMAFTGMSQFALVFIIMFIVLLAAGMKGLVSE